MWGHREKTASYKPGCGLSPEPQPCRHPDFGLPAEMNFGCFQGPQSMAFCSSCPSGLKQESWAWRRFSEPWKWRLWEVAQRVRPGTLAFLQKSGKRGGQEAETEEHPGREENCESPEDPGTQAKSELQKGRKQMVTSTSMRVLKTGHWI